MKSIFFIPLVSFIVCLASLWYFVPKAGEQESFEISLPSTSNTTVLDTSAITIGIAGKPLSEIKTVSIKRTVVDTVAKKGLGIPAGITVGTANTPLKVAAGEAQKETAVDSSENSALSIIAKSIKISKENASSGALVASALKAYTFSGSTSEAELFKYFRKFRVSPAYAKSLSKESLAILKSKNFGAGTIAVTAGAIVFTAQQGLDIPLHYKLLISLGCAILVFLFVRYLQDNGVLD